MTPLTYGDAQGRLRAVGQEHVLQFWPKLDASQRADLLAQIATLDEALSELLINEWIRNKKHPAHFNDIRPVNVLPPAEEAQTKAGDRAFDAGEAALRAGRVGMLLVAGGQGTRLGFHGPKGAYPIGPLTGRSLFAYHADKLRNATARYGRAIPWYIMVGDTNDEETRALFKRESYFGLDAADVLFFRQRMMPCVSNDGLWILDAPHRVAANPNGHGGTIPALIENGIVADARRRGIDTLSYFQVDNWAIRPADPYFIGNHVLAQAEVSSKVCRKNAPREAVGVHCVCDGVYQVIEYTELDLYPQLLSVDRNGELIHFAGNTAIHLFDVDFIVRVNDRFDEFPWHCSHKAIPYIDDAGAVVRPKKPNGYKFETFVFDSLRYLTRDPVALEIRRRGEYTPIKEYEGPNSVLGARASMNEHWATWIEAAGGKVARDDAGRVRVNIEISPAYADSKLEFLARLAGRPVDALYDLVIEQTGRIRTDSGARRPGGSGPK